MGKKRPDDKKEHSKRAPGNVSWRKRKTEIKKFKEKKLLKELEETQQAEAEAEIVEREEIEKKMNGRSYTVGIALPGSIMDNAQSPELRTYLAGQIARAAVIFEIDEIIIFDETAQMTEKQVEMYTMSSTNARPPNCNARMVKILQYLECPQYLRKFLFPLQEDLQYAGVLNPLDCLHHLRADDLSIPYREAVVLNKPIKSGKGSFCDAGLKKEVQVDKQLKPGLRITVKLKTFDTDKKKLKGTVVSPTAPTREQGYYWGYNVRLARSLGAVFSECPYSKDGYDVIIGTSDKGQSINQFDMPQFRHVLIVFGGLKGLESCVENDQSLRMVENISELFHVYLNTCPNQGSRTIRTEEAVMITMSALRSKISGAND